MAGPIRPGVDAAGAVLLLWLTGVAPALADATRPGGFDPAAQATLLRRVVLLGWSERDARFGVDRLADAVQARSSVMIQTSLPATGPQRVDGVSVSAIASPDGHGCAAGSATLVNPLRRRTHISGMFCPTPSGSWRDEPSFLDVTDLDEQGRPAVP